MSEEEDARAFVREVELPGRTAYESAKLRGLASGHGEPWADLTVIEKSKWMAVAEETVGATATIIIDRARLELANISDAALEPAVKAAHEVHHDHLRKRFGSEGQYLVSWERTPAGHKRLYVRMLKAALETLGFRCPPT